MSDQVHAITAPQYALLLQLKASPSGMLLRPLRDHFSDLAALIGQRFVTLTNDRILVSSRGAYFAERCSLEVNGTAVMAESQLERGGFALNHRFDFKERPGIPHVPRVGS